VHGKPRIKLPLTEEVPLSTTKSDGMWIFLHVRCKPPTIERVAQAMPAPPGQQGASSLTWCDACGAYHWGERAHFGRHMRRALTKKFREW
jgi:hypothetical protein